MSSTVFKSLTDTTYDSVEGYRKAAEKADNPHLKNALNRQMEQRQNVLDNMNAELQRQGDELVTKGTLTGELHQMWLGITDMFENGDEAAAERVEEGEDYIKGKFQNALEGDSMEPQERAIVEQCYAQICEGERFGDVIEHQFD